MNSITIAGNIGRDIEIRTMPNGDPVGNFSVADSQGTDKPTIWCSCQIFGKRAQSLAPYLLKGQQVTVTGTVTEREWVSKEGDKRKSMELRVNDLALQGGKRDDSAPRQQAYQAAPQQRQAPASAGSGFDDMDDDINF